MLLIYFFIAVYTPLCGYTIVYSISPLLCIVGQQPDPVSYRRLMNWTSLDGQGVWYVLEAIFCRQKN